jgi:hypothetical protein
VLRASRVSLTVRLFGASCAAIQELPNIFGNQKFHYHVSQVPILCLTFCTSLFLLWRGVISPCPTPKLLLAACNCLFNIFAATQRSWRLCHEVVTRDTSYMATSVRMCKCVSRLRRKECIGISVSYLVSIFLQILEFH